MSDVQIHLCGGIFFSLLTEFASKVTTNAERMEGKSVPMSYPKIMKNLVGIGLRKNGSDNLDIGTSSDVTKYRSCELESRSTIMPFQKAGTYIAAFDENIENHYSDMVMLTKTNIADLCIPAVMEAQRKNLVKALTAIILMDNSIDLNDDFFIAPTGETVKKSVLIGMNPICFESFLLGVWHFCICKRAGTNKQGKTTYDWLYEKKPIDDDPNQKHRTAPLRRDFFQFSGWDIEFIDLEPALQAATDSKKFGSRDSSASNHKLLDITRIANEGSHKAGDASNTQGQETIEAEVIDEGREEKASDSKESISYTYIEHQVNQGANSQNFTNSGTINIYR